MNIKKSKLDRVILSSCVSTSGYYQLMLAEHIVAGKFCYDVLAFHNVSRSIVCRHYCTHPDDSVNKAEALRVFDEFREQLTAPAKPQERDEPNPFILIEPN